MLTLGIESSCDDTSAAVLEGDSGLLANVVSGQDTIHARFGGVVPELASRKHLESIHPIVDEALDRAGVCLENIDLIAVTQGPGLIGSLLVGYSYAKAISYVRKIPYVGVDHMAGHLLSVFLENEQPTFPYIALLVSGGTSSIFLCKDFNSFELLGRTRDDAAGEAFDKVAKILNLGYPGGPCIAREAEQGDKTKFSFPRARLEGNSFDFSFSGLKTAVLNQCNRLKQKNTLPTADICASFQEAVVEVLVEKTLAAASKYDIDTIVLGGGVSANGRLRQAMKQKCRTMGIELFYPRPTLCTDNAAMIALTGFHHYRKTSSTPCGHNEIIDYDSDVYSRSKLW
jgi:N6-L-threonylcarbamoyladenine synthase